jgi:hypothetical protein
MFGLKRLGGLSKRFRGRRLFLARIGFQEVSERLNRLFGPLRAFLLLFVQNFGKVSQGPILDFIPLTHKPHSAAFLFFHDIAAIAPPQVSNGRVGLIKCRLRADRRKASNDVVDGKPFVHSGAYPKKLGEDDLFFGRRAKVPIR